MSILKVQLEDSEGNIYYLKTDANNVFCTDGQSVQTKLDAKINTSNIIQDSNTDDTTKVVSAAVAKNLQNQINNHDSKLNMIYITSKLLKPSITGDTSLSALITRLIGEGYYFGVVNVINYSDLPTQDWTCTAQWQYSFDTLAYVEVQQLYHSEKYSNWLKKSSGTWDNSTWYVK